MWSSVAAITVNIPQTVYEFARGDNVTLPCTFTTTVTSPKLVVITWIALAQVEGALDVSPFTCTGRLSLFVFL